MIFIIKECYIDSAFWRELFDNQTKIWTFRNVRDIVIGTCLLAEEYPNLFDGMKCDMLPELTGHTRQQKDKSTEEDRIFGASSEPITSNNTKQPNFEKYPWLCSLR